MSWSGPAGRCCRCRGRCWCFRAVRKSLKPWRQAMILPQGRRRLLPMAAKARLCRARGAQGRGPRRQGRPDRNEGAACPARSTATTGVYGAVAACARRRRETARLQLARGARMSCSRGPASTGSRICAASPSPASSPGTPPDMVARAALVQAKVPPGRGEDRRRRRRPRSLHCAAGRRGRRARWCPTSTCRCRRSRACACWSRRARCCPVPALLHRW